MKTKFTLLISVLLFSLYAQAQMFDPVSWSFKVNQLKNNEAELVFSAEIEAEWHLYSMYFGDGGPLKLKINYDDTESFETIGKAIEVTKPHTEHDEIFNMDVQYFSEKAEIRQKIKINSVDDFEIKGELEYQACIEEKCVAFFPAFSFKLKGTGGVKIEVKDKVLKADETSQEKETKELPTFSFDKVENDSTVAKTITKTENIDSTKSNIAEEEKISDPNPAHKETIMQKTQKMDVEDKTLWYLFGMAFLAGLMAILTPCVFPMIPMTVTFFMNDKDNKAKGRFQAIIYGLSIILIYTVIGTIVAIAFGPSIANWLSTHWLPNILFFLIFMFFAASFLGMFEIVLPSWLVNMSVQNEEKGGITGSFFMAFTLVLVSFSCTGPLVGSILVESAGGKFIEPIVGMLGFSLAFALPFTLFAFFPSWLQGLPKSGGWLNSVKVVLGFIELALGLKFLSVADQTYHWGILDREVYLAFWIIIFALMGLYLLGKIKFSHDSDMKFLSVPRLMLVIITFSFVMYLVPGMFGAPLKALSGYLPPQTTHDFDLARLIRENASSTASISKQSTICEKPKFSESLHLPHGLEGYFDYEQGLACAKKLNKPIFIDFTGHGCVNCREMEARVWSDPKVLKKLKEDYVIIALYVDDKTQLPESEWKKNKEGRWLKTIGRQNSDFQINTFGANAQPYYLLLDHDGNTLVPPRWYDRDIDEFVEFLEQGKKEFDKKH